MTEMNLKLNNNTYGGLIYSSDFCTDYEGTRNIASRIFYDLKFDEQCRKNCINRDNERKKKNA